MKKFNATKMMALLMALCLITSTFVGSTLAKYTTQAEGADSARVAKFGVEITATSNTMFAKEYTDEDATYAGLSVEATEYVVAPGTKGTLADLTITGTPEVAVRVTNDAELTLTGWEAAGDFYCPIVIKVGTTSFDGTAYASAALFEEAVEAAIEVYTHDYAPGTDLSTVSDAEPVVSWEWAFDNTKVGAAAGQTDAKDTDLGDKAVAGDIEIKLDLTTTVTQID